MPDKAVLEEFIATVESNRHDEAIDRFYADDATMQENLEPPRRGKPALLERERGFMAKLAEMRSECVRPVFVSGDQVVIRWNFDLRTKDGTRLFRDELAYQRWEGSKIIEERFYYDPNQAPPPR
jgi:ketosteroid isomerase-like protein